MLALAHTLIVEGLHDADFLARYCAGFNRFRDYLLGAEDGVAKIGRLGRRLERNFCRQDSRVSRARWPRREPSSTSTGLCSAAIMASSRFGRRSRWPPCSARSVCRAEASASATAAWKVSRPAAGFADADSVARPQSDSQLHPGGADRRPAAQSRAAVPVQRPGPRLSRYRSRLLVRRQSVSSSSGSQPPDSRVAAALRRSSSTIRGGPRLRAMPTSCCRRPRRSSATISARARATDSSSR